MSRKGQVPIGPPTMKTLKELLKSSFNKLNSKSYVKNCKWALSLCQSECGDQLDLITPIEIKYAMSRMVDRDLLPSSINAWISTSRAVFEEAKMHGLIQDNPFKLIKGLKGGDSIPSPIIRQQEQDLLQVCKREHDRCLVVMALYGGMRAKEISNFNAAEDIMGNNNIIVRSRNDGATKSGRSRVVSLPGDHHQILVKYCSHTRGKKYPFYNRSGHGVSMRFSQIKQKAGVNCKCHDLRSTCATRLVLAGVAKWVTQLYMGHSTYDTTDRYYTFITGLIRAEKWTVNVTDTGYIEW